MATAALVCRTARQAKRAGPKLEAGPEASAMRKAGKASPARDERLANWSSAIREAETQKNSSFIICFASKCC